MSGFRAICGSTLAPDVASAVNDLRNQFLGGEKETPCMVIVFCSPDYDLDQLGPALKAGFPCPVVGCTTSGQIGPHGFQKDGITAVALSKAGLMIRPYLVAPLEEVRDQALAVAEQVARDFGSLPLLGFLLVDGLSMVEELLASTLHHALGGMTLVGGSAGDNLAFHQTKVCFDGVFRHSAAVLVVLHADLPFVPIKFQHFIPTNQKLVATAAQPKIRVVETFNGIPAAKAYAKALGLGVDKLNASVFSAHPLMLLVGDDYYVRSIQRVLPDGGLVFYCAIDEALVFTLGQRVDSAMGIAGQAFDEVFEAIGEPQVILGCDCILRRLELEEAGLDLEIGSLFARKHVVGFSTYGEQWNGMHINQTFTGLALGCECV